MAKLHISKNGKGPELILLHGWGSSSKVWQSCVEKLSTKFNVWCVDLPGHGESHAFKWDYSVAEGIEILAKSLPPSCSIVGWSLGGFFAQHFANQHPQRINNLMLIASTPKFIASKNWVHGMSQETFDNFVQQFSKSPQKTLQNFCALQVLNTCSSKQTLTTLLGALSDQQKQLKNIQWGLQWLQDVDLRTDSVLSDMPIDLLQGEQDAVCSCLAAEDTVKQWGDTNLFKIPSAGHAPFISHPSYFLNQVETWL